MLIRCRSVSTLDEHRPEILCLATATGSDNVELKFQSMQKQTTTQSRATPTNSIPMQLSKHLEKTKPGRATGTSSSNSYIVNIALLLWAFALRFLHAIDFQC